MFVNQPLSSCYEKRINPVKNLQLIVENDYQTRLMQKRGLIHTARKGKLNFDKSSCIVTEPSEKSLRLLKTFLPNSRALDLFFYSIDEAETQFLQKYIPRLSHLKKLAIKARVCNEIDDQKFTRMSRSIMKLKQLTNLSVNLVEYSEISSDSITKFFHYLTRIPYLQALSFQIFECYTLNNDAISKIIQDLKKLSLLEGLAVDFKNCYEVDDDSLISLTESFSSFNLLKALKLHLKGCYNVTDHGVQKAGESLSLLQNLNQLEINFDSCFDITEACFIQFGSFLSKLKNLQYLKIAAIDGPQMSNQGLKAFGDTLVGLVNTKILDICLGSWQPGSTMCEEGILNLVEVAASLRGLETLKLHLWALRTFDDDGLLKLLTLLGSMTQLKELMIQFGKCKGITKRGVCNFQNRLKALNSGISFVDIKSN